MTEEAATTDSKGNPTNQPDRNKEPDGFFGGFDDFGAKDAKGVDKGR